MSFLDQYILDAERAFSNNELLEGKKILEEVLSIEPTYGKAHNHMAWLYLYHYIDYTKAEVHLKLAMKYTSNYGAPYIHMAELLFQTKRYKELEQLLAKAKLVAGISEPFIFNEFGRIYEVNGKYTKAVNHYKKALLKTLDEQEFLTIRQNIKRCRKKRWIAAL